MTGAYTKDVITIGGPNGAGKTTAAATSHISMTIPIGAALGDQNAAPVLNWLFVTIDDGN